LGALSGLVPRAWDHFAENLRFFTRLPVGTSHCAPDFRRIGWAAPLAGALVGALGALAFVGARGLSLPSHLSAGLAVATQLLATGALHEDGLADVADGFGGGRDRAAKLAILRDSRIGTYGAAALILMLLIRVDALAALGRPSAGFAAAALILAGAAARAGALAPLALLDPARTDGAGAGSGGLGVRALAPVAAGLVAVALVTGVAALDVVRALFACVCAAAAVAGLVALARRQIGGQTGDVCGAAAALADAATLIALLIGGRDD
jgi:adenosylcobinamide-GDP ribazoletransferase